MFLFDTTSATNDSIQTTAPSNKIESEEITEYTYKTYGDYFIDYFNLPSEAWTRDAESGRPIIDFAKMTRKGEPSKAQILYDGNVFYTVTEDDLSGAGTQTDPYVIHSLKGFLFFTSQSMSKYNWFYDYVELGCDLVFNDETFDKDGKPSGGDGVFYNWQGRTVYSSLGYFDGKNHTIYGLYGKSNEENTGAFTNSLFGCGSIKEVKNLHIRNSYFNGVNSANTCSISSYGNILVNCSFDGVVSSKGNNISPLIAYMSGGETRDCVNYGDLYHGNQSAGGIVAVSYGDVINCKNYGNIYSTGYTNGFSRAAGIIGHLMSSKTIKNCDNYGNIVGGVGCAGIVTTVRGTVVNCNNYGNLEVKGQSGGIVASAQIEEGKNLIVENCNNYGVIRKAKTITGEIVGYAADGDYFAIVNCYAKSNSGYPILSSSKMKRNVIKNCKIDYYNTTENNVYYLMNGYEIENKFEICDIEINVYKDIGKKYLFYRYPTTSLENLSIKNVYINSKVTPATFVLVQSQGNNVLNIEGCVFDFGDNKLYYGSKFSGFYFSWKTGTIGLVTLGGRGSFQGTIDEEWLKNKGFKKGTA